MQRWWPSGQRGGPCAEQGRHARPSTPTTRSRGPRGPNPKDGTVDPKIATVGVPTAWAKCNGALSFVTSTDARRIASADCRSVSLPQPFTARHRPPPPSTARTTSSASPASSGPPTSTIPIVAARRCARSEEHTSELQSHVNLVCRLLLEKKKKLAITSSRRERKRR